MSADKITVRELIKKLSAFDQDAYVVLVREDDWTTEGMVDGPQDVFEATGWEIRSGWIPSEEPGCERLVVLSCQEPWDFDSMKKLYAEEKLDIAARIRALADNEKGGGSQ